MDLNRFVCVGRLTGDPKLIGDKESPNRIVSFCIANNRGRKNKEYTNYFNCIAFSGLADLIFEHCRKGDLVGIDGEWKMKKYVDKKTGMQREVLEVIAYGIQFLSKKKLRKKESQEDFEIY